jgi:hypothetical protein
MQCVRAFWFRDVCRVLAVIVWLYSIHPMTLGVGLPRSQIVSPFLEPFAPAVVHAQPAPEPTPENGAAPVLVVGRTLSSFSVAGLIDNRLTITYTVFNQQATEVRGILLVTRLRSGVRFETATPGPDRHGRELAWSLGTLPGFGFASVQLTVLLDTPTPVRLDDGARAFGTLNARAVDARAVPALLRTDTLPQDLLRSTLDANLTDPFILARAAELGNDPERIFAFVRDRIGYESYQGSLRGARGTLWSKAGNALDQASLLIALLRASGIPARYAQGTLPEALAQQLILSMFPPSLQRLGFVPAGTEVADPANDPQLLAETRAHYWVEFDRGNGFEAADPTMVGARIGQAFAVRQSTFAEVASELRHQVTIRLKRELTNLLTGLFGAPAQEVATVLEQTFATVEVVGKPLSIGHFVNSIPLASLVFTSVITTYSPYIAIGNDVSDARQDSIIRGQNYQEVLTNFSLGSQILTGLFLETELSGPDGPAESFERTLLDRIGFEVRQNGGSPSLTFDLSGPPILTDADVFTVNVLAGLYNSAPSIMLLRRATEQSQMIAELQTQGSFPPEQSLLLRTFATDLTRLLSADFLALSDFYTNQLASLAEVRAYFNRPRLLLVSSRTRFRQETRLLGFTFAIDLRRDTIRAAVSPGQNTEASPAFHFARGIAESIIEHGILSAAGATDQTPQPTVSTVSVFTAAAEQNIATTVITRDTLALLDTLDITPQARARITTATTQGKVVITPQQNVMLAGMETIAWYEINPETGETIGVTEDGGHQSLVEYAAVIVVGSLVGFFVESISINLCDLLLDPNTPATSEEARQLCRRILKTFLPIGLFIGGAIAGALLIAAARTAVVLTQQLFNRALLGGFLAGIGLGAPFGAGDPPVPPFFSRPVALEAQRATISRQAAADLTAGAINGNVQARNVTTARQLSASWATDTTSSFQVQELHANGASVQDAQGIRVGTGTVALRTAAAVAMASSGEVAYHLTGQGSLAFYAPATTALGASGTWEEYVATLSGTITLQLTTDALTLNGSLLPAGAYSITTNAATLAGSGPGAAQNFVGTVTVETSAGGIELGPSTGVMTVNGVALTLNDGVTLAGFSGTVTLAAGESTDTVTLDGNASHVLHVFGTPAQLTTDQNTVVQFDVSVETSLADTYMLTAAAPEGWTVAMNETGRVTVTPAPGLQSGRFLIYLTAQSQTMPELVAQGTVNIMLGETPPGVSVQIVPDTLLTVPFSGAEVPSAFRVTLRNLGPTPDTFNVSFLDLPAGFEVFSSGTTISLPAGETGVVGFYLRPVGQIGPPGTQISFRVEATSTTNPAITATDTEAFTLPEVHGITLGSNSSTLNTIPGVAVTTTLMLTAVGNVSENVTLQVSGPGLTASTLNPATLAPGVSTTRTLGQWA